MTAGGFEAYVEQEGWWLREYALFMAVKGYYNDGPWTQWPLDIRLHQPEAMREYGEHLRDDVEYQYFVQYVFSRQWNALRAYAREQGIRIIGDVPIYVPLDSADVWANPENFQLTRTRVRAAWRAARPTASAPTASIGATRSMIGARWSATATTGGSSASARRDGPSMLCASIISGACPAIGAFPLETAPRAAENGSKARA